MIIALVKSVHHVFTSWQNYALVELVTKWCYLYNALINCDFFIKFNWYLSDNFTRLTCLTWLWVSTIENVQCATSLFKNGKRLPAADESHGYKHAGGLRYMQVSLESYKKKHDILSSSFLSVLKNWKREFEKSVKIATLKFEHCCVKPGLRLYVFVIMLLLWHVRCKEN